KVDVSVAAYFGSVLLFGAPVAVADLLLFGAPVGLSQLVGHLTLAAHRNPLTGKRLRTARSALGNAGRAMVATGLSALAYYAFVPHVAPAPLDGWENAWALPLAAGAIYLATTLAVAVMVGLQLRQNPVHLWANGRRSAALEF